MPVSVPRSQATACLAGTLAILLGVLVLAGWGLGISSLRSILPGTGEMKANAALGLVLAGSALLILGSRASARLQGLGVTMALVVALLGLATLAEYVFGWRLGIDEWLFRDEANVYTGLAGRMSPYTALALGVLGLALAALPQPRLRPLVWLLSALVTVLGAGSLIGYAWRGSDSNMQALVPPVAPSTALALTVLGVGALLASLERQARSDAPRATRVSIELQAVGGFAAAFLLLVFGGAITYRTSVEFARSERWVAHTQAVRAQLGELYSAVSDAQSETSDYLLTGEQQPHKDDYRRLAGEARDHAKVLGALVADNPAQQRLLVRLAPLMEQRLGALEQIFSIGNDTELKAARAAAATEDRTRLLSPIRHLVQEMDDAEVVLLAQREGRAAADRQNSLLFLVFTLGGAAGIFLFLLHGIRREMLARAESDERVRQLNTDLERRIAKRTAALERKRRRFADLFEFSPDALVMTDAEGTIVQVNRQTEALFGWTRSELVGQPVQRLMPEDEPARATGLCEPAVPSATPQAIGTRRSGLRALRKDGSVFPADVSVTLLQTQDETAIVTAVRDTSERERLTHELHEVAVLYRHTLDNMLEGCRLIGFDWRYRYCNAAAARQVRRPREALIDRTVTETHPGIEATPLYAMMRSCMDERTARRGEVEHAFGDGSVGTFEMNVLPTSEGIAVFSVDVTERKRAEAETQAVHADLERRVAERTAEVVQAREAAEAANRAKSAFLATMSHEIRTPMNGVVGMVEVLSRSPLSEDQADAVATVRASAFSLLHLIDDILDFSKIEAGRLELERAPVALPELVEGVCQSLSPVATAKGVELSLFIDPQVPGQVWSDATRLRQVLYNLAGNAIKFSAGLPGRHGRVSVRVGLTRTASQRLVLRIADNGIGMAPETLDRLFSSFTQAEVSTTRRFGGTGLGLAICKRLVDLMNGEIAVQSTPNKGSTFTVTLPVDHVEGSAQRPAADLAGLDCILVGSSLQADDVRTYLEHSGVRVHRVATLGAAARQAGGLDRPVVVIHTGRQSLSPDTLHAAFADTPDVRHLLIVRGRRRGPPIDARDAVTLDGNCLLRSSLLRAVAVAAGRASPGTSDDSAGTFRDSGPADLAAEPVAPPTVAEARAQGRLILIAEDDEVNQKVILRQLEVLGYAAEIAGNGVEALRLWRAGQYALLLSDLHMPEMDGYALAGAIRAEEAKRGLAQRDRMPILALTANALRGEAIRAREAGMDDYLTKPLPLPLLKTALTKWLPQDRRDTAFGALAEQPHGAPQAAPVLDVTVLHGLVGDDPTIVRELLADYRTSVQHLAAELRAACAAKDLRQVGAVAHKLKSSSRSVGALALGDLCAELENAVRAGTRIPIPQSRERLEAALLAVDARIADLLTDE